MVYEIKVYLTIFLLKRVNEIKVYLITLSFLHLSACCVNGLWRLKCISPSYYVKSKRVNEIKVYLATLSFV